MRYCSCGKAYKYKQNLNRHIKIKHSSIAPKDTDIKRQGRTSKDSK
jgi:hypothetical protein